MNFPSLNRWFLFHWNSFMSFVSIFLTQLFFNFFFCFFGKPKSLTFCNWSIVHMIYVINWVRIMPLGKRVPYAYSQKYCICSFVFWKKIVWNKIFFKRSLRCNCYKIDCNFIIKWKAVLFFFKWDPIEDNCNFIDCYKCSSIMI